MPTIEQITEIIYATMPIDRRVKIIECATAIYNLIEYENKLKPIYQLYLYPDDCKKLLLFLIPNNSNVTKIKESENEIEVFAEYGNEVYSLSVLKVGGIFFNQNFYQTHITNGSGMNIVQFIENLGYKFN